MDLASARKLLENGLYQSAESLLSLTLATLQEEDALYASYLEVFGDAVFAQGNYCRSLAYFKRSARSVNSGRSTEAVSEQEAALLLKASKCHLKLNDSSAALR